MVRLATLFVCHGGGPMPLLTGGSLPAQIKRLREHAAEAPRALLVISAHWEAGPELSITSGERPQLIFDYYGFPPQAYQYKYDAPGDPALARRVQELLQAGGHGARLDAERGWDHGVFVPLLLAFPAAKYPVVCLSLHASLDAAKHLDIGRALAPLRDEGVLILGSGNSYHNMSGFDMSGRRGGPAAGADFDEALLQAVVASPAQRTHTLEHWTALPGAHAAHPRPEHLLPLHVAAGAASDGEYEASGQVIHQEVYMGAAMTSFKFG